MASVLDQSVSDDLEGRRLLYQGLLDELRSTEKRLAVLKGPGMNAPGMRKERVALVDHKEQIICRMRLVKQKIKESNRDHFCSQAGPDDPEAFVSRFANVMQTGLSEMKARLYWLAMLAEDRLRMIDCYRVSYQGKPVAPSVPDDFEAWRHECYDKKPITN